MGAPRASTLGFMSASTSEVVVTGAGRSLLPCDARPFLRNRKMLKLLSTQDSLAIVAAAEALRAAGLGDGSLGERAGLFFAVGHVSMSQPTIDTMIGQACDAEGNFSDLEFARGSYYELNPLMAFHCMPNAPAFHVSTCFDLQGPYFITFPGPGQFYTALDEARLALLDGRAEVAVVGASAAQNNVLVAYHFSRTVPPIPAEDLIDAAGFLVLETAHGAAARGATVRARLLEMKISYRRYDLERDTPRPAESFSPAIPEMTGYFGSASLPTALALAPAGTFEHRLATMDGIHAASRWEVLA